MSTTLPQNPALENPYAAPAARVSDAVQVDDFVLADRGTRLGAALLDGLVFGIPIFFAAMAAAIALPAYQSSHRTGAPPSLALWAGGLLALAGIVVVIVINCVLLHRYGQTIAKRWLSIKVVRSDGSRCPLGRIFLLRWLPVTAIGAIPYAGFIMRLVDPLMIFREDRRCLHDLIADTKVVKT